MKDERLKCKNPSCDCKGDAEYTHDLNCENCDTPYDKWNSTAMSRCDFCSEECERNWNLPPDAIIEREEEA